VSGTSSVSFDFSTDSTNSGGALYFVTSVDGGALQSFSQSDSRGTHRVSLASSGEHTIMFGRSDEASYGHTTLHDIKLGGGKALSPSKPRGFVYEALGDSITAGFKVTGSPMASTEDVFKTYEYHLAQHWGIDDWNVIARSGIGIVERVDEHAFHKQYECASFEFGACTKQWDFSKRIPDVVSVNLGTNDYTFAYPLPTRQQFGTQYGDLLKQIRSNAKHATIFAIVPIIYSCVGGKYSTMRDGILDAVQQMGDSKVHVIETGTPADQWLNCGSEFSDWTHPTVQGHKKFADRLAQEMDPLLPKSGALFV
jgi:lysophospholipase L1-like esterase